MVQFGDKKWSSMLALCTHAAWDAYNYANAVESHKASFKPENPPPSLLLSPLQAAEETHSFGWQRRQCLCSGCAFVIRDVPGKTASWENISKVGTGWNGSFPTEPRLLCQLRWICVFINIESVGQASQLLITGCFCRGQVSTQLRALQCAAAAAAITQVAWTSSLHTFSPLKKFQVCKNFSRSCDCDSILH